MEAIGAHKRNKQVVLLALPYLGHINPILQLGSVLHSNGFSITVIHTQFNPPNPSNHPQFLFLPIPDTLSDPAPRDFGAQVLNLNSRCEGAFRELIGRLVTEQEQDRGRCEIACIVYDGFMYFAESVANHFMVPSIVFRPTSATNVLTYNLYPQLQEQGHVPLKDSMLQDLIPGLHPLIYKDLSIATFSNVKAYLELISQVNNIRSSSAIIWNTLNCLEHSSITQIQKQHSVPVFSVGPLQIIAKAPNGNFMKEDSNCIKWLDTQAKNSVLYVSLGSVVAIDAEELAEMAWGLANSEQPFLWVIRPESVLGSEWIELLPEGFGEAVIERGCIVKWAPQREVLAHFAVGGFWSHCGWNSTLESVSEGVPVMCKPFFGDQRMNARYFREVWKVGVEVGDGFEREEIERVVRKLMVGKEGEVMRKRAMELKDEIDISIREGGSSYTCLSKLIQFIMA